MRAPPPLSCHAESIADAHAEAHAITAEARRGAGVHGLLYWRVGQGLTWAFHFRVVVTAKPGDQVPKD